MEIVLQSRVSLSFIYIPHDKSFYGLFTLSSYIIMWLNHYHIKRGEKYSRRKMIKMKTRQI